MGVGNVRAAISPMLFFALCALSSASPPSLHIPTAQCLLNVSAAVYEDEASAVSIIAALGLPKDFHAIDNASQDAHAFVIPAPSENRVILALRGTDLSYQDLKHDIWCLRGPFGSRLGYSNATADPSWYVSRGFMNSYLAVRSGVLAALATSVPATAGDELPELFVTGHSLGAAMATIAAMDIALFPTTRHIFRAIHLMGFASPRTGNAEFAAAVGKRFVGAWELMNYRDVIPHFPPRDVGYNHAQQMGVLGPDDGQLSVVTEANFDIHWSADPVKYHHCTTYAAVLERLAGSVSMANVSCVCW